MATPTVLVTGDIVLDCHLYGGAKTAARSLAGPVATYRQVRGGADLMKQLLASAADAAGAQRTRDNEKRATAGLAPLPPVSHAVSLAVEPRATASEQTSVGSPEPNLPPSLTSYGVWTPRSRKKDHAKEQVWRIEAPFGYGSTEPARTAAVYQPVDAASVESPLLTVIDDGGILFRHATSRDVWPPLGEDTKGWVLLKMSWPLGRGELWPALAAVKDRLIVVVSAADLRREDVQINSRLSWEQCVEHTVVALQRDPVASELLRAAYVVVTYESEGALWYERGAASDDDAWRLVYRHDELEGDHAQGFDGTTYGFQTCFTAAIAHRLVASHVRLTSTGQAGPFEDRGTLRRAISQGIVAGLSAKRLLLELGHGPVGATQPGIPLVELGRCLAEEPQKSGGFVEAQVPASFPATPGCHWTILEESERSGDGVGESASPLTGLAQFTALHGPSALTHLPALRMGPLFSVDRSEIESLRTIEALIRKYEGIRIQTKPLSIGVFGPPGAGKSFGVKALAKALLGEKSRFLEFNLSQFKGPDELVGAFHRVRDEVLSGTTPVAFWDEFDSQRYRWLQYLLAPMQDGTFQEGQVTHPIGKCVFVFAGGTAASLETFGVADPGQFDALSPEGLGAAEQAERRLAFRERQERHREFVLLKGPDFVSRLHGFLNVLGPNPRVGAGCVDVTWPVRRALILRGILRLKDTDLLGVDRGLLNALLAVPVYRHGARSFEKILTALSLGQVGGRLIRSALPPVPLLDRETDAAAFHALLTSTDAFRRLRNLETLAGAVHDSFVNAAKRSQEAAELSRNPHLAWQVHESVMKAYSDLDEDKKAGNRAAARRIADHLALIGYSLEPGGDADIDEGWVHPLTAAIEKHVERLARAEHLGWWAERQANGWVYAPVRDDGRKRHPLLVEWAALSDTDRDKDRASVRAIPALLVVARFKAVPVKAPGVA